jgi:GT2 family glycosyltransferase
MPPVTVIILNWNAEQFLGPCLTALLSQDYPQYQVVVVDNGSTDGSVALVRQQFPAVSVIEHGQNSGFAAGNNVALRQLGTPIAVLLNPDVVAADGWLSRLIAPFLTDERIGVVGCKLYYGDGRTIQHAGGILRPPQAIPDHYGVNQPDDGQWDQPRDVDYVTGAAMAVRKTVLDQIGLLDEGYFLYFEEADLCWRAKKAGYRVVYEPGATAVHFESALSKRGSPFYLTQFHTGRWRFLLKHYPGSQLLEETIPAEKVWLAKTDPVERMAAAAAYRRAGQMALTMNDETMDEEATILTELGHLREQAWSLDKEKSYDLLLEKGRVEERPFVSHFPLFGPLIARFRATWNNVAARWYVRGLLEQQNEFNRLIAEQTAAQENRLIALDREQTEAVYQIAELTAQVTQLTRRLRELEKEQG